jgi:hypothetical protein
MSSLVCNSEYIKGAHFLRVKATQRTVAELNHSQGPTWAIHLLDIVTSAESLEIDFKKQDMVAAHGNISLRVQ